MIGFGSLKQMNDTIKHNREMLGKKKTIREMYKEEIKNRTSRHENIDLKALRKRIADRQRRNLIAEAIAKIVVVSIVIVLIVGVVWFYMHSSFSIKKEGAYMNKELLFNSSVIKLSDSIVRIIEYYPKGPKAEEGYLKNGMKHQNFESYYSSGEQFRSALYFNDSVIVDYYFYKWGDTIENFPSLYDTNIHHITLTVPEKLIVIEFDYYDGKTITGTYKERKTPK